MRFVIKSVVFISLIAALGGFLFGYDTGVISGAVLFIKKDFLLSDTQVEFVVSAALFGAILGAFISGGLSDWLGRRKLLIYTASLFILSAVFTALAVGFLTIILGRIFVGIAIGISSMISPLYIAEISPAKHRGTLVALNQFAITIGIVVSYAVDFGFSHHGLWRWMMGVAAIPSFFLFVGMFFMPDSPRWLLYHGLIGRAKEVLTQLRETKEEAEREIEQIHTHVHEISYGWKGSITPWVKKALIIGISLAIFQQFTGINTVIYYAPQIFQLVGFKEESIAILATFCVGIINVLATIFALWLLDKVGRRKLLLTGLSGMIVGLTALALLFHYQAFETGVFTLISLGVYVASFAIGIGPVFWVLISEIYPLNIRGKSMSISAITNWGANLIVALTFLTLINKLGSSWTFSLYAGISIVCWLFSFFFVPETKGYTLEEIQKRELYQK